MPVLMPVTAPRSRPGLRHSRSRRRERRRHRRERTPAALLRAPTAQPGPAEHPSELAGRSACLAQGAVTAPGKCPTASVCKSDPHLSFRGSNSRTGCLIPVRSELRRTGCSSWRLGCRPAWLHPRRPGGRRTLRAWSPVRPFLLRSRRPAGWSSILRSQLSCPKKRRVRASHST